MSVRRCRWILINRAKRRRTSLCASDTAFDGIVARVAFRTRVDLRSATTEHDQWATVQMLNHDTPRHRILLIEDDADLSEALGEVLEESGHNVLRATDGGDGLRQMRACRPDIVVLDLMMPNVDGWQFRVAQRADPMLAATPVVVISASNSPTAAAMDADMCLRKPLDAETLLQAIEDVLNARRRRLEPAIIAQTERLAAIGTLAAGLAHEINNPLTYVMLELAHVAKLLPTVDGSREVLDRIEALVRSASEGAERIRLITGAIRTFTRPADVAMKPIDIRTPITSAITLAMNEIRHRATLTTRYDDPPLVMGNEGRLGQVFLNLLTNAAHAIPEGAPDQHEIRVVAGADPDGDLCVEVSDTGSGIAPHLMARIFEPFFSTKPDGKGTGLGLPIVRNIIDQHRGQIVVGRSELGGAAFRVTIPVL
jgi:signal transduction histidine kinase